MNWHREIKNWHKSSRTHHEENACVEVEVSHGVVGIRDTKRAGMPTATRPAVVVSSSTFASFLGDLRAGTAA
jgi:hypothetical protein